MRSKDKKLVIVGILLCLTFAVKRLVDFYHENVPVAEEGQCVVADIYGQKVQMIMYRHFPEDNSSLVVEPGIGVLHFMTYTQQRNFKMESVECK